MLRPVLLVLLLAPLAVQAQGFRVVKLVERLDHPWSLAFLPEGRMLVTERVGRLNLLTKDFQRAQVKGVPAVATGGQAGLFDVALHPRFAENRLIYLAYEARTAGGIGMELARARLDGTALRDVEVIFRETPRHRGQINLGGRIVFDRAGYLYLSIGDGGAMERSQRPDDDAGSMIRLNDDGSVPKDNPFVGKAGWRPEKFDLGHRNPQGAALHPQTGALWTHEHGPQGGDEINIIHAGTNYGWPVITYGVNYGSGTRIGEGTAKPGMAQPIYYWVPSIAPSGMAFYTGDRFPKWKGNLFIGALADRMLVRLELDGEKVTKEERLLKDVLGRIRDVRMGPDGLLYLLTDESDGVLARLEP
jgi:glucose/arabinose dehydrogenase